MDELLKTISNQDINPGLVIFLMLFSLGIAIFHTLIFSGLFDLNIKPKWLFFLLNPVLIGLAYLIEPSFAIIVFAFLFASVFISGIIGMITSAIKSSKADSEEREKFKEKYNIAKTPLKTKIFSSLGCLGVIGLVVLLFFIEKLTLLLIIIPVVAFIKAIFFPTNKANFYKLQAVLPSSKMNAVAMGLVEVIGDLVEIEPLISPRFKAPCIGYIFTIEQKSTDDDGRTSWSTIYRETNTGIFKIKDETGFVKVDGKDLEYYFTRIDNTVTSAGKRYSETYLRNDDYFILIGNAQSDNGETVIKKDDYHKVFGVAIPNEVAKINHNKPLLKAFLSTLFFITLIIIYIILN